MPADHLTIIIPVYNEEKVICHTLDALLSDGELCATIVTVCNGCLDRSFEKIESYTKRANATQHKVTFRNIEIEKGCKISALNAGYEVCALSGTVILLDADIRVEGKTITKLATTLKNLNLEAASPKANFAYKQSTWLVRRFYEAASSSTYNRRHRIANVIALSESSANALFPLPTIIADDSYIQRCVGKNNYKIISSLSYRFECPRTFKDMLKVQTRICRGNYELAEKYPNLVAPKSYITSKSFINKGVLYAIKLLAKSIATWQLKTNKQSLWERDESTR